MNSRNTSPTVYHQYLMRGINTLPAGNVLTENCFNEISNSKHDHIAQSWYIFTDSDSRSPQKTSDFDTNSTIPQPLFNLSILRQLMSYHQNKIKFAIYILQNQLIFTLFVAISKKKHNSKNLSQRINLYLQIVWLNYLNGQ